MTGTTEAHIEHLSEKLSSLRNKVLHLERMAELLAESSRIRPIGLKPKPALMLVRRSKERSEERSACA